jgi:hypothetical protein
MGARSRRYLEQNGFQLRHRIRLQLENPVHGFSHVVGGLNQLPGRKRLKAI